MRKTSLPAEHYAAAWKTEGAIKTLDEVTDLGCRYARLPDGSAEKEALLLELCQAFHPYLMKYLVMICRGSVPQKNVDEKWRMNQDVKPFLLCFLPRGERLSRFSVYRIVRYLHLAFKGMETAEIYDILMSLLVGTIKGYDPAYSEKVASVIEVIRNELSAKREFSVADANRHVEFDSRRYLRMLVRLGLLEAQTGEKERRGSWFVRTLAWPPPRGLYEKGVVGVAHYISKFFRFRLHVCIIRRMREIEAKEGVYSLESWNDVDTAEGYRTYTKNQVCGLVDEFQSASGMSVAADVSLLRKPLDISKMSIDWVRSTDDALFRDLTRNDRYLLYLVYARELDIASAGASIGSSVAETRKRLNGILEELKREAGVTC